MIAIFLLFVFAVSSFDIQSMKRYSFSSFDVHSLESMGPATNFTLHPFVALIVSGGVNNTIQNACTGSILNTKSSNMDNHNTSFILTTTYCILNRQDPGNTSLDLLYKVLIEDPINGNVTIAGTKFSLFNPELRILHPSAGTINNYTVDVTYPPGPTKKSVNISVNVFDVGIIKLDRLIDIPGVSSVKIESPSVIQPGTPVTILGYGAPDFLHLHNTTRTETIGAINVQTGKPPEDLLFIHDNIADLASTTPDTPQQAVEVADEGGPILNQAGNQIAIGQATWRVKPDNNTILTFASLGPIVSYHQKYISETLAAFIPDNIPGGPNPGGKPPTNGTNVQSYGTKNYVNLLFFIPLISFLLF